MRTAAVVFGVYAFVFPAGLIFGTGNPPNRLVLLGVVIWLISIAFLILWVRNQRGIDPENPPEN